MLIFSQKVAKVFFLVEAFHQTSREKKKKVIRSFHKYVEWAKLRDEKKMPSCVTHCIAKSLSELILKNFLKLVHVLPEVLTGGLCV